MPLLPGFTFPIDHSDASAVRIILECQNKTICRGPHSIFGRLRKEGIEVRLICMGKPHALALTP